VLGFWGLAGDGHTAGALLTATAWHGHAGALCSAQALAGNTVPCMAWLREWEHAVGGAQGQTVGPLDF
jgi:hypothetical protein